MSLPAGIKKCIPLFAVPSGSTVSAFVPLNVLQSGEGGNLLSTLEQPIIEGSTTLFMPSANSVATASYAQSVQRNGLFSIAVPYTHDPLQGTVSLRRNTGGLAGSIAIVHTNIQGQDVRSFLYGVDAGTPTQSVPLLATPAGVLQVSSTPIAPATIPTAADLTTTAATVTVAIAANTARRFAIIQNLDITNAVRIGDASIGAARGILVAAGESVTLETQAEISVFPVAGTPIISRTEIVT